MIVKEARQLRLATSLLLNEGADKVKDGFELMTVCIWQQSIDILPQASGRRVLIRHNQLL